MKKINTKIISVLLGIMVTLSIFNFGNVKIVNAAHRNEGTWFWPVTKNGCTITDYAGCGGCPGSPRSAGACPAVALRLPTSL